MKVPKQVVVLGEVYKIVLVEGLIEREGCEGCLEPWKYLISLDSSLKQSPRALKRVLLHEIAHAFAMESGLHEILPSASLEQFCQAFSGCVKDLRNFT